MDLFGPIQVQSINHSRYCFVLVDDLSRFSWTLFLKKKSEAIDCFITFVRKTENELGVKLKRIRSDQGGEFVNNKFKDFCDDLGYSHEFSSPRTPQQNGVAERKNRTL